MLSALTSLLDPSEQALIGKKGGTYLITFAFDLDRPSYLESTVVEHYWGNRWFQLQATPEKGFYGTRGGVWGNLFSFDIRKVLSELLIECEGPTVRSQVRLDFRYQIMSEWNLVEFKLEHLLFRSTLLKRTIPPSLTKMQQARLASQLTWVLAARLDRFPAQFLEDILLLADCVLPRIQFLEKC